MLVLHIFGEMIFRSGFDFESRSVGRTLMIGAKATDRSLPYGLLEIDPSGSILYHKPEGEHLTDEGANIVGHNLFADLSFVANMREFQDRLAAFRQSRGASDSFAFAFEYPCEIVKTKILLASIEERGGEGRTKLLLVHIRKA